MDSKSILDYNLDKTQVPAIDQKRILAFINNFTVNTVTFLNKFAVNCESKFVDFESKLMQMESSLSILESKLHSIPDLDRSTADEPKIAATAILPQQTPSAPSGKDEVDVEQPDNNGNSRETSSSQQGIRICEDERFRKYFKMVQVGVPAAAVRIKMEAEGLDPTALDDPDRLIDDIPAE